MSEEAFIYEAIRTPRGKNKGGALNEVKPVNLVVGLIDDLPSCEELIDRVVTEAAAVISRVHGHLA